MALCFGTYYPKFDTENAAQIPTSFGGLVFMMSAITLLGVVIAIEAIPVSSYLRARQEGNALALTPELLLAAALVIGLCVAATVISLRLAVRKLDDLET
jgi:ABC-2 type transport system permease protein